MVLCFLVIMITMTVGDNNDHVFTTCSGLSQSSKWSECSKETLEQSLAQGLGICLHNFPETYAKRCGDGIVDDEEECDCGRVLNAQVTASLLSVCVTCI